MKKGNTQEEQITRVCDVINHNLDEDARISIRAADKTVLFFICTALLF